MGCQPLTITLSDTDQQDLEKLALRPSTPQQIAQRARIVLEAALGKNNAEIAKDTGSQYQDGAEMATPLG